MSTIEEGTAAPDFELPTDGGGTVRLSDLKGKKAVVYFYPADDNKGCTLEAVDFSKHLDAFQAAGAVVIGNSPDTLASQDKFKAKHDLSVILAADPDRTAIEAYGVWVEKQMYGRKYMGVERATFLVGSDGRIAKAWHKVKVKGHVEAVLAASQSL